MRLPIPIPDPRFMFERLHDEVDRAFWPERVHWTPAGDVYEVGNEVIVEAELPGVPKDSVRITHTDHTLTLQGEARHEAPAEKPAAYYQAERRYGSFHRTVMLLEAVEFSKARAKHREGVLRITLPKLAKPEEKPRTIAISE